MGKGVSHEHNKVAQHTSNNKSMKGVKMKIKYIIELIISTLGTMLINIIGKPTNELKILLMLMVIDLVTGTLVSAVWHKSSKTKSGKLSSRVMFKGIVKKLLTLVIVVIAYQLDILLNIDIIRYIVIISLIIEEIISISETIALTGIQVPTIITKSLDILERRLADEFSNSDK